jgi:signal transduction histidine kinase
MCIVVTASVFILYDFFVRRDINVKTELLDAKRKFVRFVSHEVRTPLNSVCMGLSLIREELQMSVNDTTRLINDDEHNDNGCNGGDTTLNQSTSGSSSSNHYRKLSSFDMKRAKECLSLTDEIMLSAQSGVQVLNDFLHYDKIEMVSKNNEHELLLLLLLLLLHFTFRPSSFLIFPVFLFHLLGYADIGLFGHSYFESYFENVQRILSTCSIEKDQSDC